jgi:hypothetical protein
MFPQAGIRPLRSTRSLLLLTVLVFCGISSFAKVRGNSGDFNGDGFADLCIGVPFYTVGTVTIAGSVNCLYGSASGLQATGVPAAQLWTQNNVGLNKAVGMGDQFGFALATGDFNNDGFDDLCIASPFRTISGVTNAGAVTCIYGSRNGLQVTGSGAPGPQLWNPNSVALTPTTYMDFGYALIAGDFNHDGYDDLCIGVPGATVSGIASAGLVECMSGSATGLTNITWHEWDQSTPGIGGVPTSTSNWGAMLVAADFNRDGFDDLCVGAPNQSISGDLGAVNCLYGSSTGLQSSGSGGPASQYWHPGETVLRGGTGSGLDDFGSSLAVGDFNNDGYADLAIGSPQSIMAFSGPGRVSVLYGSPTGLQATGTGAPDDQLWMQGANSVKGSNPAGNYFGRALTAGDFNHDGYDDLCIGAPGYSSPGKPSSADGGVSCLYGSQTGLQASGVGGPDDQLWDEDSPGVPGVGQTEDFFGWALSAGDFNGDGYLDLAVGIVSKNSGGGAVDVLYGSGTGIQATATGNSAPQFWDQASAGVPGSGGGNFGQVFSH